MASQGPLTTASWYSDATGFGAWIVPPDAEFSDDIYTVVNLGFGDFSDSLRGFAWGFTIPPSATINGIQFDVERKCDFGGMVNVGVFLFKGAIASANRSDGLPLPLVDTFASYGGPADLWGLAWTPADINAATFEAGYAVFNDGGPPENAYVDQGVVTVFFTLSGRVQWQMMGIGAPQ